VGAWTIQVTLRDCTTNAPLGPPFNSLVTFHRGGTLSESAASLAFAPNQRSSGHGVWIHQEGHTYLQRMVALILFDTPSNLPGTPGFNPSLPVSPGFFAGWQTVTHTLRLLGLHAATHAAGSTRQMARWHRAGSTAIASASNRTGRNAQRDTKVTGRCDLR
jgi:hypothetical protein